MKKRIVRIFAALLALLMLSACMVGCDNEETPDSNNGEKVVLKIAFVKLGPLGGAGMCLMLKFPLQLNGLLCLIRLVFDLLGLKGA